MNTNGARKIKPMNAKQRTCAILSLLMLGFDKFEVKAHQNNKDGFQMTYEFSQLKRRDNVLNETPVFRFIHNQSENAFVMSLRAMFGLAYKNAIQKGKVDLTNEYNKDLADMVKGEIESKHSHSIEDIYEGLKIAQEKHNISKEQYITQQANFAKKVVEAKKIYELDDEVINDFATHMITGAHYLERGKKSNVAISKKINQIL